MTFNFSVKEWMLGNGNGVPTFQFYRQGFNIGNDVIPRWQDVIIKGNTSLTLLNAKNDGLNYLKLFGGSVVEKGEPELLTYATVENEAHSTFNLSKFTVVGSPNITNDGIASNFAGAGNYLYIPFNYTANTPIEVTMKIKTPTVASANSEHLFFINTGEYTDGRVEFWYSDPSVTTNLLFRVAHADTTSTATARIVTLTANTEYWLKWTFANGIYKAFYSTDNVTFTQIGADISAPSIKTVSDKKMCFGDWDVNADRGFRGSIDLKFVSVKMNGQEIFSGNRTGIDVLKPDDWSIPSGVSAPTITNDGILTSTDSTHYIKTNGVSIANKPFKIKLKYKTASDFTSQHAVISYRVGYQGVPYNIAVFQDAFSRFYFETYLGSIIDTHGVGNSIQPSTWYDIELEFTSTKQYLRFAKLGEAFTEISANNTQGLFPVDSQFSIGLRADITSVNLGDGQIDLNSVQFFIDSNLVYQPCLKIPYTLASNGDKIVDSYYLDRVQDAYNQELPSPYTVLDTTQQTATYYGLSYINSNNGLLKVSNNTVITDGTTETIVTKDSDDTVLSTATAQDLLASSTTNQDVQEVTTGTVTKNVGLTYLMGQEAWTKSNDYTGVFYIGGYSPMGGTKKANDANIIPSEGKAVSTVASLATAPTWSIAWVDASTLYFKYDDGGATVDEFKAWLNGRYADGNTIFITYPLASAVTSTVTEQPMDIEHGTNTVEITQASIDNLELEVSYKAGVLVTIEEIQDAQLDNSVTVTIGDE